MKIHIKNIVLIVSSVFIFFIIVSPSARVSVASTRLGGLNLGGYCSSIIKPGVILKGSTWYCGNGSSQINMTSACQWQYPGQNAVANQDIAGNPYSWTCYAGTPTPMLTVTPTVTITSTPTSTITPILTITPTATPTIVPTPTPNGKPIVIFVPGYGSGLTPDSYTYIINDIAAQGFTVEKYYPTFQDISNYQVLLNNWTAGVGTLAGDNRVVVIGHSVGGDVAMNFCEIDTRCVASINLDGGANSAYTLSVPLLYLQGGIGAYCGSCTVGRTISQQVVGQSSLISEMVYMPSLRHMNFTDYAANQSAYQTLVSQGYFGTINYQTAFNLIDNQINVFLSAIH